MSRQDLSPRQSEVLFYLAKGFSNAEIAGYTGLARNTVADMLKAVFVKLDVSNRVEAAVWAAKQGLV